MSKYAIRKVDRDEYWAEDPYRWTSNLIDAEKFSTRDEAVRHCGPDEMVVTVPEVTQQQAKPQTHRWKRSIVWVRGDNIVEARGDKVVFNGKEMTPGEVDELILVLEDAVAEALV